MKRGVLVIFILLLSFNFIFAERCESIGAFSLTDLSGSMNQCVINCSGEEGKMIDIAREANKVFIDVLLDYSGNKVGLIGYSKESEEENYHPLSVDDVSLKTKVDEWSLGEGTCICCGINDVINKTLEEFSEEGVKSIVVMSDGKANVKCAEQGTGSATQDAINAAYEAYNEHGIIVYSVGFGANADMETLTSIAESGLGNVYYGENNELIGIYRQIAEDIRELPCVICGDGALEGPEQCDDGNKNPLDGCSPSCKTEIYDSSMCGDGILFAGLEECDDSNKISGDGCSDSCYLETEVYWAKINGERIDVAYVGETIRLVFNNIGSDLSKYDLTDPYSFEIFERDYFLNPDDGIRVGEGAISGTFNDLGMGSIIGEWTISEEDYKKNEIRDIDEFYFKIDSYESNHLKIFIPDLTPWCKDYKDEEGCNSCDYQSCSAATNSINKKVFAANPEIWDDTRCWDYIVDPITLCTHQILCECGWNNFSNECGYAWSFSSGINCDNPVPPIGNCVYDENILDTCDDDILEYSWSVLWTWDESNEFTSDEINNDQAPSSNLIYYKNDGGIYHYDPFNYFEMCVGGKKLIVCPEQIRLSFFGFFNFIIVFLSIVSIYGILFFRKKLN